MNIVAIVQARVGSTRLPNKIFYELSGKPLIWHVINRLKISKRLSDIVIATTENILDDKLASWADKNEVKLFRGSETNVLNRYYNAAIYFGADIIVRITADDPFKDAIVMDSVIDMVSMESIDFGFNNKPASFPEGLDIEVFTFQALEKAHSNSIDSFEQEHVTQYFHRNPSQFSMKNLTYKENLSHLRWTIDTIDDYNMTCEVYEELYKPGNIFLLPEILTLLQKKPEIALINNNVERSIMYKKINHEKNIRP
jgi:spore coat polysaccharide biosynthesis protein SpsF